MCHWIAVGLVFGAPWFVEVVLVCSDRCGTLFLLVSSQIHQISLSFSFDDRQFKHPTLNDSLQLEALMACKRL